MIAMARKQREKDPRPRPQPPRTSQARRVAGIIVGPGSVVPGPLELSLSRDHSRTLHRSGSRRSRIGRSVHMERRAITFYHFLWILTGIVTVNLSRATCFSFLWVLAGIDTVKLSRAACFVIVLVPAIVERHVLIPTSGAKSSDW